MLLLQVDSAQRSKIDRETMLSDDSFKRAIEARFADL